MNGFAFLVVALLTALVPPSCAWFTSSSSLLPTWAQRRPAHIPSNVKVLILPGFGNDSDDYFLKQALQGSLTESLLKRGWAEEQVRVMPLSRPEWLQVFLNGVWDRKFWQADAAPTRAAYNWYLSRVAQNVHELTSDDDNVKVVLVGHSAGGWLARAALGFGSTVGREEPCFLDLHRVLGIVTLGAPQLPPPPQVMDMTRGALRITNEMFPGSYHSHLFYITVIGDSVQGVKQERKNPLEPTDIFGFAYNAYEAVCGDGTTIGDGVVPICAAHLENALQLNLKGVLHSINAPDRWYGSDAVLDMWHGPMLGEINRRMGATTKANSSSFLKQTLRGLNL